MRPWNRHYQSTRLPTLVDKAVSNTDFQVLQKLYTEVHNNYRHLADIRFKLLGLVPAVSVIACSEF